MPHCWDLLELLTRAGVSLKLETDGSRIDDAAADRLSALGVQCIQISVDGATAATHERVRPGSSFTAAIAAIERLAARGSVPQFVFVPTRFNVQEIVAAFDLAVTLGCGAFVTGPLMRIGRAATDWQRIACSDEEWRARYARLKERAASTNAGITLSIYPWDIITELETRLEQPQRCARRTHGKVKLLNALPFAPRLRRDSLEDAWRAYCDAWRARSAPIRRGCRSNPALLTRERDWACLRNADQRA